MTNTERVLDIENHDRMLKGVKFLDEYVPGWAALINLLILDIQSTSDCVISQLYGKPWDGWTNFGFAVADMWAEVNYTDHGGLSEYDWAVEYGFDSYPDYEAANDAWRRVIRARL